jgi:hypothetical protein
LGKIEEWFAAKRQREKLDSKPYDEAALKLKQYLDNLTLADIETVIEPTPPDPKRWILEVDGTHWRILSKVTGKIEEGNLSTQADELLNQIHTFTVEQPPKGYFAQSLPFDGTRTVSDGISPVRFVCQLRRQHQEPITNLAISARKLYNRLKPKSDEPEVEG